MKLLLKHTDLQKAGITDMSSEDLTIGKMWQAIEEAPLSFHVDTYRDFSVHKVSLYNPRRMEYSGKFKAPELIDALFEAYQYVINYEGE